jgi:uncharacterized membrane protein
MSHELGNELSKSRTEFLIDGVYAIVMTLLVLEIGVPQLTHSDVAAGELPRRLLDLWPLFMSYGMSFIILGFFWIYHHVLFHYIKRVNRVFVWLSPSFI